MFVSPRIPKCKQRDVRRGQARGAAVGPVSNCCPTSTPASRRRSLGSRVSVSVTDSCARSWGTPQNVRERSWGTPHRSTGPWQRRAALPLLHAAALPVPGRLAAQWRATSPGRALETAARKRNLREMSDKKELHSTDAGKGNQEDFTWCVCLLLQGLDAAINNNLLVQSCLHGRFLVSRTVVKFCSPYPQLFFLV